MSEQPDGSLKVTATVTNTGKREGDEVVQLYVTDMYASVKTRITELKGFERIHLAKGASQQVSFTLQPYDLSLLNDRMDRVVEPGEFKIMVGGVSPDYVLGNKIKDSVGYQSAEQGVQTTYDYRHELAAHFRLEVDHVDQNLQTGGRTAYVRVTNDGNLTDVGLLHTYAGGQAQGDALHFELAPRASKVLTVGLPEDGVPVVFTTKYQSITL